MKLPTYDEISRDESQLYVFEYPTDSSLFVIGPPGSGKTTLALQRAEIIAKRKSPVVLITYNRMLKRAIELSTTQIKVSTIHSYVWHYFKLAIGSDPPTDKIYVYNWLLMQKYLLKKKIQPRITHVIVDEGQDLPKQFYQFLREFVAKNITVFADEDQAIDNKGSKLQEIKEAGRFDNPILSKMNHRNTPEIEKVCRHFHSGRVPLPEVARSVTGEKPRIILHQKSIAKTIAKWYTNKGGKIGIIAVSDQATQNLYQQIKQLLTRAR